MLELKNIVKDYVTDNNVTHALKGISLNFRKNEFVSILGASGCGKTTTLNIVGGLDRYTSGDLLINGKSTKDYTDRDWDTYRNHSIGFIFQTYNLIAHQNILKNVELALTISGVDKEERKARAYEALKKVGLEGMEKKKPNQLSGGQCQRVAIARALINNPEILLADEPTGALDSETSIQIMDLLKEVASDRLVIMVTHNPDLAYKYSTRIVKMSDGLIIDDSNPFDGNEPIITEEVSKGKKKKSSMSLLTSTGLSLSNLVSKIRRTILVTIAGSIGIIGVSAVLAVSRGVKDFIAGMQNDMLSSYPIEIAEESVDYTSLMTGLDSATLDQSKFVFDPKNPKVGVDSMIQYLMSAYSDFTKVKTNTIDEKLVNYIEAIPSEAVSVTTMDYGLDVTNNIFGKWYQNDEDEKNQENVRNISLNGLTRSYIAELQTVKGFKNYASYVDLFTDFMKEMPDNKEYLLNQYDLVAGNSLELGDDDLILVVDKNTTLTDVLLAEMGLFNHDDFIHIAMRAIGENEINNDPEYEKDPIARAAALAYLRSVTPYPNAIDFNKIVGREYTYYPQDTIYEDEKVDLVGKTATVGLMNYDVDTGAFGMLSLNYNLDFDTLNGLLINTGSTTPMQQLTFVRKNAVEKPETVSDFTDYIFGEWVVNNDSDETLFTLNLTPTTVPGVGEVYSLKNEKESITTYFSGTIEETTGNDKCYYYPSEVQNDWGSGKTLKISAILRLKDDKNFGCLDRGLYYSKAFGELFMEDSKNGKVTQDLENYIASDKEANAQYNAYVTFKYWDQSAGDLSLKVEKEGYATSLNGDMSSSFSDLFSGITGVNYTSTDMLHLRSISGLKAILEYDEDGENIIGKQFDKMPRSVSIYPKDFEAKDVVTEHLDKWNDETVLSFDLNGEHYSYKASERESLTYTDTIEMIITVIDTLINAITISLVVFTSLSLVVSCFMIAVITYISVVERIKEIGVIRSLGGRKGDVASLFVMETMLTGLFSGAFGIGITYILALILNIILKVKFGIAIAHLTIPTALIMILVSVVLSVVSGLVPSQSAAHKDPVVALRSGE